MAAKTMDTTFVVGGKVTPETLALTLTSYRPSGTSSPASSLRSQAKVIGPEIVCVPDTDLTDKPLSAFFTPTDHVAFAGMIAETFTESVPSLATNVGVTVTPCMTGASRVVARARMAPM